MRCSQPASPSASHSGSVQKVACTDGQVQFAAGLDQRGAERRGRHAGAGAAQQARARHRAERHGDLQFGVIVAAGTLQRVRPAMVEHVFAVAVRLRIHRRHRDERAVRRRATPHAAAASRCAALADPLSSSALRKAWLTNGLSVAGTGVPVGCRQCRRSHGCSVRVSADEPSGMARRAALTCQARTCPRPRPRRPAAGRRRRWWCGRGGRPRRTPPRRDRRHRS